MTDPERVIGFLNLFGDFDPTWRSCWGGRRPRHDHEFSARLRAHGIATRERRSTFQTAGVPGNYADASLPLASLGGRLNGLGVQGEPIRAQALETLGTAYLGDHRYSDAAAVLQDAVEIRLKSPADIWELALAQERLGEALAGMGQPAAVNMLKNAARDLDPQWGATNLEAIRARSALARWRADRGPT
jgi:hypothetical protein